MNSNTLPTSARTARGTDAASHQESISSRIDYEALLASTKETIKRRPVSAALLAASVGFILGRIVS